MSKVSLDSMNPSFSQRRTRQTGRMRLSHSFTTTLKRPLAGGALACASMVVVREA